MSAGLSVCPSVCLSASLSVCLSVCPSVCPSVYVALFDRRPIFWSTTRKREIIVDSTIIVVTVKPIAKKLGGNRYLCEYSRHHVICVDQPGAFKWPGLSVNWLILCFCLFLVKGLIH